MKRGKEETRSISNQIAWSVHESFSLLSFTLLQLPCANSSPAAPHVDRLNFGPRTRYSSCRCDCSEPRELAGDSPCACAVAPTSVSTGCG